MAVLSSSAETSSWRIGEPLPESKVAGWFERSLARFRSNRADQAPRRVLVLCLGGIGDTVLALAALRDLRCACPDDHLTALAMWPQSADLLSDLGIFDEVLQHNFQRDRVWRSLWRTLALRMRRYDATLLAFPTNRFEYNALSFLIGAKARWGHTYQRGGNLAYLRFLLTDRIDQQPGRHTIDENRALVAAFAGRADSSPADISLGPLAPEYHAYAERMSAHLGSALLGVHPGSSTYKGHAARRWPAERFGQLCRLARDTLGIQPVIFGASDEIGLKLRIQAYCPEVFLAHGPSIRHTAALIRRCDVFVSNDSSLAHVASACDVPTVMICGPTDARTVGPYRAPGRVMTARLPCAPCFAVSRKPLRCTHPRPSACMEQTSVEQVLSAVADIVGNRQGAGQTTGGGTTRSNTSRELPLCVLQSA
ncbi:MAG: glycosyltransferase family 9 protein [Phycisphaerae bacterium]|nr:glycosyltransferase family 9 protein [Phycisphaerae bacterium]